LINLRLPLQIEQKDATPRSATPSRRFRIEQHSEPSFGAAGRASPPAQINS
jgi:hypothetical protein